jgi:hypothetical protein
MTTISYGKCDHKIANESRALQKRLREAKSLGKSNLVKKQNFTSMTSKEEGVTTIIARRKDGSKDYRAKLVSYAKPETLAALQEIGIDVVKAGFVERQTLSLASKVESGKEKVAKKLAIKESPASTKGARASGDSAFEPLEQGLPSLAIPKEKTKITKEKDIFKQEVAWCLAKIRRDIVWQTTEIETAIIKYIATEMAKGLPIVAIQCKWDHPHYAKKFYFIKALLV